MAPATATAKTKSTAARRLTKSRKDKMIDGVCAGFAEYLGVDPTGVRIVWGLSVLFGGLGFWLYVAGMILVPVNPEHLKLKAEEKTARSPHFVWGLLLILLGALFLSHRLWPFGFRLFPFFFGWHQIDGWILPFCLIVAGIALLSGSFTKTSTGENLKAGTKTKRLACSDTDRKIGGVCGGLSANMGVDSTVVRLIAVLLTLANPVAALAVYGVLWIILPKEK
jgi:phage shock protein C